MGGCACYAQKTEVTPDWSQTPEAQSGLVAPSTSVQPSKSQKATALPKPLPEDYDWAERDPMLQKAKVQLAEGECGECSTKDSTDKELFSVVQVQHAEEQNTDTNIESAHIRQHLNTLESDESIVNNRDTLLKKDGQKNESNCMKEGGVYGGGLARRPFGLPPLSKLTKDKCNTIGKCVYHSFEDLEDWGRNKGYELAADNLEHFLDRSGSARTISTSTLWDTKAFPWAMWELILETDNMAQLIGHHLRVRESHSPGFLDDIGNESNLTFGWVGDQAHVDPYSIRAFDLKYAFAFGKSSVTGTINNGTAKRISNDWNRGVVVDTTANFIWADSYDWIVENRAGIPTPELVRRISDKYGQYLHDCGLATTYSFAETRWSSDIRIFFKKAPLFNYVPGYYQWL